MQRSLITLNSNVFKRNSTLFGIHRLKNYQTKTKSKILTTLYCEKWIKNCNISLIVSICMYPRDQFSSSRKNDWTIWLILWQNSFISVNWSENLKGQKRKGLEKRKWAQWGRKSSSNPYNEDNLFKIIIP